MYFQVLKYDVLPLEKVHMYVHVGQYFIFKKCIRLIEAHKQGFLV
jgi:hypothetical protein